MYSFIFGSACWVLLASHRLSLIAASGGYSPVLLDFSLPWLTLQSHGLLDTHASAAVARGLSCCTACGVFLEQGLNLRPLHWQGDSSLLYHQRSLPSFWKPTVCGDKSKTVFCMSYKIKTMLIKTLEEKKSTCCTWLPQVLGEERLNFKS